MRRFFLTLSVAAVLPLAGMAQYSNEQIPTSASLPSAPFQAAGGARPIGGSNLPRLVVSPSQSPFEVTPKAGAWLICAATYTGPNANNFAEQVVRQLREKHRMAAYLFSFADLHRRQEEEEYQRRRLEHPERPTRRRVTRIEQQCAVLVGGYRDEVAANDALKKFKKLPPPEVYGPDGQLVKQNIQFHLTYDAPAKINKSSAGMSEPTEKQGFAVNPYLRAFAIRNPTLPKQQSATATNKPDPFWKTLNSDEEYSLLKCKKNFTLVIKCFAGASTIQSSDSAGPRKSPFFSFQSKEVDVLKASEAQAHELARFLRQNCSLETYVLHMRQGSIVTVGAFESLEDPNLANMQSRLRNGALKVFDGPALGAGLNDFMPEPMPMRVPRL